MTKARLVAGFALLIAVAASSVAHAKSGDPAVLAGYLGKSDGMDEAIARFAFAFDYAEQTDRDYDALAKAAREQRISVAKTE